MDPVRQGRNCTGKTCWYVTASFADKRHEFDSEIKAGGGTHMREVEEEEGPLSLVGSSVTCADMFT